jgi:hypothetical protein
MHLYPIDGAVRRECVDHIIVLGEMHLRRVLKSCADYSNSVRTHRSLQKDAPVSRPVQRFRRHKFTRHLGRTSSSIRSDLVFGTHRLALSAFLDKVLLYCRVGRLVHLDLAARSPETMVRRDATLTIILSGLREFQQKLDFYSLIDAQSPCAWARAYWRLRGGVTSKPYFASIVPILASASLSTTRSAT